ncbi:hypothetical protein POJ06DRAFT_247099 [Lipomyces tetrasporus]|uniref:Uncharacterized protein n=1 Tax=Lipomyces tetrasporus TaxID=54092 RepID=A0AAD7VV97_9ASCO|nr:uncharacterized protein POJ06DRAFT_247099 [Lipomyces tetrasporus]KAJ8103283.1 hypothetical protein POJ06DRAFT_247099 [Lipomyces tetrasporus]
MSQSWDTPMPSVAVSNSWDTPEPSVQDNSWDVPAPTTQANSWDTPTPTNNTWDARTARAMPLSIGRSSSHSRSSSSSAQSFANAQPAHSRAQGAPDSQVGAPPSFAASHSAKGAGVSGGSWNSPAPVNPDSWVPSVSFQSNSRDTSAPSAQLESNKRIQTLPATGPSASETSARSTSQPSRTTIPPVEQPAGAPPAQAQQSEKSWDTPATAAADMSWDIPAPAAANNSWGEPTPAPVDDSWDQTAKPVNSWGASDASAARPQPISISWGQSDGAPERTLSRNSHASGGHTSRPSETGTVSKQDHPDASASSTTSKTAAGLGASRWAPTNRPQRRRFEERRQRYEDDGGSGRGYGNRDKSDYYSQLSATRGGSWTGQDPGATDAGGDMGSPSAANASGNNYSNRPGSTATTSNDWDTAPANAPTRAWGTASATSADDWSAPTPAAAVTHKEDLAKQQELPSATLPNVEQGQVVSQPSASSWDVPAPAVNDTWETTSAAVVNDWGAPAATVDDSRNAATAPVKEQTSTSVLSVPADPGSTPAPTRGSSWAAAPEFVPKSSGSTEFSPSSSAPDSALQNESTGWDAPVPMPDNDWTTPAPTTASNGWKPSSQANTPTSWNSEPGNVQAPRQQNPEPPQLEQKIGFMPTISISEKSSQPSQSSWDTPSLPAADNSWDTSTTAVASSWDAAPERSAQSTGWNDAMTRESLPPSSSSWSKSQSERNVQNGRDGPKELPTRGGGLAGSKYSNEGGPYSGGRRGGIHSGRVGGGYERPGGHRDDIGNYAGGYGSRGRYGRDTGNYQENERPPFASQNGSYGRSLTLSRSDDGDRIDNSDPPSVGYDSTGRSRDAAPAEVSEQLSRDSPAAVAAVSWDTGPVAAAENWDASANAGKTPESAPNLGTAPSASSVPDSWDAPTSNQSNDSWNFQQPSNSW